MASPKAEPEIAAVPLRTKFNHELDPDVVREHPAFWDRFRAEGSVFRSDAAGKWNVWYLLGFEDVREAFQRSDSCLQPLRARVQPRSTSRCRGSR